MKLIVTAAAFALVSGLPAFAAGDAEAGAKVFNKCQTCHVVVNEAGETLAGKNAKTGPNLYGVVGRVAGSYEGFKYGAGIELLTAAGYVWTEEDIAIYVQDPTKFLDERTTDPKAKSKMAFKLKGEKDAADVAAFLATFSTAAAEAAPAADAATGTNP
ncbi:MAG: c-type cytochrome [Rhodobacterales bacterium]|nr:c-type cytochrome [Rhodobacterales bacterium]